MATEKKPKRKRLPILDALRLLFDDYGFADWGIIARAVDGDEVHHWEAGTGKDPIGDAQRAKLMLADLLLMQGTLVEFLNQPEKPVKKPPKVEKEPEP